MHRNYRAFLMAGALLAAGMLGCQGWPPKEWSPAPVATAPAGPRVDAMAPCPERLHDICGLLLLYYKAYEQMPERLEDLGKVAPGALPPLVCPASGKPYVNNPRGLAVPNSDKRIVVYDSQPHDGKRWVILVDPPRPGKALVARVRLEPDHPVFSRP